MNKQLLKIAKQSGYEYLPTVRLAYQGFDIELFAEILIENVLEQVKIGFDPVDIKQFYKE